MNKQERKRLRGVPMELLHLKPHVYKRVLWMHSPCPAVYPYAHYTLVAVAYLIAFSAATAPLPVAFKFTLTFYEYAKRSDARV